MSVITFWNDMRTESGLTSVATAFATLLSVQKNNKILLISTSFGDMTMENSFYPDESVKGSGFFNIRSNSVISENGIEGLDKLISSNKLDPSTITDYTKVVFKGRLEILSGKNDSRDLFGKDEALRNFEKKYLELIKLADKYYDYVIVDLDKRISEMTRKEILNYSIVNSYVLTQKMSCIKRYEKLLKGKDETIKERCVPIIGKYMRDYKYNAKNISRFLQKKDELDTLPYCLLFRQAMEESGIVDFILKTRNLKDKNDINYIFIQNLMDFTSRVMVTMEIVKKKMR